MERKAKMREKGGGSRNSEEEAEEETGEEEERWRKQRRKRYLVSLVEKEIVFYERGRNLFEGRWCSGLSMQVPPGVPLMVRVFWGME